MIEIKKINNVTFKKNKKSSNFYIKENDGKFVRVKSAEYKVRMEKESIGATTKLDTIKKINKDVTNNYILCKYVIIDLDDNIRLPAIEISCGRKMYKKDQVCLADVIARKNGVQLVLNRKKINGNRVYKFIGDLYDAQNAIIEFNNYKNASNIVNIINTMVFYQQDIDNITRECLNASNTMILDFGF